MFLVIDRSKKLTQLSDSGVGLSWMLLWTVSMYFSTVVYIVCSPDDGHNNARNMLS